MGLIARELEARGVATLSMSSAYSITASVNPPRAVYLDYPLGHTAGKPDDRILQLEIMRNTLNAFSSIIKPGTIQKLPFTWHQDDVWKDHVMRPGSNGASSTPDMDGTAADPPTHHTQGHADNRVQRHATPQYQNMEDALLADENCADCIFLEDPAPGETAQ